MGGGCAGYVQKCLFLGGLPWGYPPLECEALKGNTYRYYMNCYENTTL